MGSRLFGMGGHPEMEMCARNLVFVEALEEAAKLGWCYIRAFNDSSLS